MTLGNSQPPLTRRQAREAAQAVEQAAAAEVSPATSSHHHVSASTEPSHDPKPAPKESAADSSGAGSSGADSSAADAAGVNAPSGRMARAAEKHRASGNKSSQGPESPVASVTTIATAPEPGRSAGMLRPEESAGDSRPVVLPAVAAFAPRLSDQRPTSVSPTDSTTGRTLTRRELRALNAQEAAEALELEAEAPDVKPTRPDVDDVTALNPPVGHWSIDQGDDDEAVAVKPLQSLDDLMNRGVGAGGIPTTTNALILPSIPNQGASSGPFSNTGEILITGSFDLPRSLGETGQHPNHFDSSDVDQILDQDDEFAQGDNAPVSASRAVSTHASTRGVMTPPKKHGLTLPVVLVVSTAALAVSVSALLFAGHMFQIF